MTLETCKIRYELAKKRGNNEEMKFWEERIRMKAARVSKYKDINVDELLGIKPEVKESGKKSKG